MAIRGSSLAGAVIPVGGPAGLPGQGTYAAWLALGNTGSLADFMAAQKGAPGGVTTLAGKVGALTLDDIQALAKTGDASGTIATLTGGVSRNTAEKLFERRSIADYYKTSYQGDYAPAIEAAAKDGVVELVFPASGFAYTLKRTANLPNGDMRLIAEGRKQVELRLLGANDYHLVVGNATTESYNFHVEGFLFTKEQASSQGAVLKLLNVYKWSFNHIRVYGDNKIWRVLELLSTSSGISHDVDIDNILERAVYIDGGTAGFGLPGGAVIDNVFNLWYVSGAVRNPADPTQDGTFYCKDNFQAIWILNTKVTGARGYAVFMKGTVANRVTNALNFIHNLNADAAPLPGEGAGHKAGSVYFDAVGASQVGGPASWSAGQGMPAILFGPNSNANTVRGYQIPVGLVGGQGVFDNGTLNIVDDIEVVGYDTNADAALVIGPAASKGRYTRIKAQQLKRAVVDQSADTAGYVLDDLTYTAISGQPLTGMAGNTNEATIKTIRNVTNLDVTSISLPASALLDLPDHGKRFFINSGGTINGIKPTYIGRRVTLILTTTGTVLNDVALPAGAGGFYLSPGGTVTTDHGRWRMTFEWNGDFWFNIGGAH